MAHQQQDFEIHQANDLVIPVKVTVDGTLTGTPIDITGATLKWAMSRGSITGFSSTQVVTKSSPSGGIVLTAPTLGEAEITLAKADSLTTFGDFYHECLVIDASLNQSTVLNGNLKIHRALLTS